MEDIEEKAPRPARSGLRSRVARAARPPRRVLDGILLIDKPVGLSSHDALLRAKGMLRAKKAGHTGTLDPLASGLLPLCFGEATKFSQDLLDADKYYDATMRLGERTDTGDAEGQIIETRPVACDVAAVDVAIARFRGEIVQVPPMYSAIKRDGKPLYEYARAGQTVERDARPVTIHALERLSGEEALQQSQEVKIRVHCSKGTYIRTLAEDIGEALGCGAHLTALRRTRVGTLVVEDAFSLQDLQERLDGGPVSSDSAASVGADRTAMPETGLNAGEHSKGDNEGSAALVSTSALPPGGASTAIPTAVPAAIPALDPAGLLQPIDALLSSFPAVMLDAEYARRFLHGQRLRLSEHVGMQWPEGQPALSPATANIGRVRVYAPEERLLGTATLLGGLLAPERLVGTSGD